MSRENASYRGKRLFDLILLSISNVLLFPLLLLAVVTLSILIKLEDRGPVLYTQKRIGLNGKVFNLYKFRSMKVNAEQLTGPVLSSQFDQRQTNIGTFMRKRALDEIPQLYNLWNGDMSIVGPRPERPELVEKIIEDLPEFIARQTVKPGLTGLAQIRGKYSSDPGVKLMHDQAYIHNMTPMVDIKIILESVYRTVSGKWNNM
ncbi:MAG: UDP-phosphate N-acetylgalactosaminyl-1-phosphate transferase [Dehalococcoidia bacterium]|nr:UDP-phosphate N-acetylgalactosaminyl-1-phosphate transferase [Dehalococcoidia bacterium]